MAAAELDPPRDPLLRRPRAHPTAGPGSAGLSGGASWGRHGQNEARRRLLSGGSRASRGAPLLLLLLRPVSPVAPLHRSAAARMPAQPASPREGRRPAAGRWAPSCLPPSLPASACLLPAEPRWPPGFLRAEPSSDMNRKGPPRARPPRGGRRRRRVAKGGGAERGPWRSRLCHTSGGGERGGAAVRGWGLPLPGQPAPSRPGPLGWGGGGNAEGRPRKCVKTPEGGVKRMGSASLRLGPAIGEAAGTNRMSWLSITESQNF